MQMAGYKRENSNLTSIMHPYLQKLKNSKTPISFQYFGNIPSVTCSQIPFLCIYYNVTLFIVEYVHKIIPDPP